jgi:hypothetical protein
LENTHETKSPDSENDEPTKRKEKSPSTPSTSQHDYRELVAKKIARNKRLLQDVMERAEQTQDVDGEPAGREGDELESSESPGV